jgi:hypothetical protein
VEYAEVVRDQWFWWLGGWAWRVGVWTDGGFWAWKDILALHKGMDGNVVGIHFEWG